MVILATCVHVLAWWELVATEERERRDRWEFLRPSLVNFLVFHYCGAGDWRTRQSPFG